ncbi:MAG TPA: protein kinase [Candidatus Eisenbacteria bacterium]|nr:protein kinase [Candidatus Eisenbacteria bacterium]
MLRTNAEPHPARPPSSPSARWGEFSLLERLGSGTFGEVWRAWDPALRREIAVKFLRERADATGAVHQAALLDEARALARIRHPGVAAVYGVAEFDGRAGLWMEYLRGPSLASVLEERGAMPWRDVIRVGCELCSALEALQHAGLVHRDIKPANVVMESDGRAVLADFGLGMRRRLLEPNEMKQGWGTPLFMAPSLLRGGAPTFRTDLYAVGVTLLWALTGRAPFESRTLPDLQIESARGPTIVLPNLNRDAPMALVDLIGKSLEESDPARLTASKMRAGLESLQSPKQALDLAVRPSIAVLPFLNRSADESTDYFSDGLADELVMVLSKIQGLRVIARTASFQFKGKTEDLAVIGAKLNVATLLEGSVVKQGSRLRVSVRLVKIPEGDSLWSESYDRTWDDVFAVQDDIAQRVVTELRARLVGAALDPDRAKAEIAEAVRGRGEDPEVHRLLMRARYHLDRVTSDDTAQALEFVAQAMERDAAHPALWCELCRARSLQMNFGWIPIAEGTVLAREAIDRALELDPELSEAHGLLGWLLMHYDRNWAAAEASFLRALDLDPESAGNLRRAGTLAMCLDRPHQAIDYYDRSLIGDPLSTAAYNNLGFSHYIAGHYEEAVRAIQKSIELAPQRVGARALLAFTLRAMGRGEEAMAAANEETMEVYRIWSLAIIHHHEGRHDESSRMLALLEGKYADDAAYQIAEVHAARGAVDPAFEWLERAYRQHDGGLAGMKASVNFRPIHSDPRWTTFLLKVGFDA